MTDTPFRILKDIQKQNSLPLLGAFFESFAENPETAQMFDPDQPFDTPLQQPLSLKEIVRHLKEETSFGQTFFDYFFEQLAAGDSPL